MGQLFDDYLESLFSLRITPLDEQDRAEHWRYLVEIGADNMLGMFLFENTFGRIE